jgi:superfamily II DNA or RNA helicase
VNKNTKERMSLRYYQEKASNNIDASLAGGINRQLLVMATGTGKTEVFSYLPDKLAHRLPGQQIVLVNRDELAKQAINKLRLRNPGKNVQQEAGTETCDPINADLIVGSVQTLGRKGTTRLGKFNKSTLDKFVVDEAHRSIANSYYNIYEHFDLLKDGDTRLLLGCTATPIRGDGEGLGKLYQKIVYTYSLRQAIEDGYLVDIKGIRVDTKTSLDGVHTHAGDYDKEELAKTVNNPLRNELVAVSYKDHCDGRQAIGFGVNIEHSKELAKVFRSHNINADAVWGADPDREDKIAKFRAGKIQVLFNAQLLTEGFDLASIECIILAAPTKSGVVFSQRVGRGTRLPEGVSNMHSLIIEPEVYIKQDCIVLDICDSTSRHSLVTLPTLLGLPSGVNLRKQSLVGTARAIEQVLEKYPHLDFSTLKDADKIEAFVEAVNLFEVKFPPEVELNSEFTWHPAYSGGYRLMLPDKEGIRVQQNLIDKWEISGIIKGIKYRGERDTMEAAFSAADDLIKKTVPECIKIVKRDAHWHKDPPTEKQLKRIRKLYAGKQIPDNLTKGEAFKLIGAAIAGKDK